MLDYRAATKQDILLSKYCVQKGLLKKDETKTATFKKLFNFFYQQFRSHKIVIFFHVFLINAKYFAK